MLVFAQSTVPAWAGLTRGYTMRHFIIGTGLLALAANGTALAQTSKTVPTGACTRLNADLLHLNKSLAVNFADGVLDNSMSGKTLRETQYDTLLNRIRLTMDLMRAKGCKLPDMVPNGVEYVGSAMDCLAARADASYTAREICDQSKWVANPTID